MRAVAVFHRGTAGGPSRSLAGALRRLAAEEGEVCALFPEPGDAADDYAGVGEVAVAPYGTLTYPRGPRAAAALAAGLARDVATLRRELRRRRPDLVVVVTTVLPAALVAARLEGVPAVVYAAEVQSRDWRGSRARALWGSALIRLTARLASGAVCCSELVAGQFPRAPRLPVAVAYPPIGSENAAGDRAAVRARYGLAESDPLIATVGDLSPGRGQDVAIRALAAIRREAPAARLLVVGSAHPRPSDREFAESLPVLAGELGVAEAVVFAGRVRDVAGVYAAADVVVNPARVAESFGRVAAEALVAGRPPVATDVGAAREVIRDGVDGILVPPDDAGAIARAVLALWGDPELARRLVTSGAARVAASFGAEQDLAAWRAVVGAATG